MGGEGSQQSEVSCSTGPSVIYSRNCFEARATVENYHCFLHVIGATGNLTPIRPEQYNVNHWKRADPGHTGGEPRSSYREF